jgi:hypothetical protein
MAELRAEPGVVGAERRGGRGGQTRWREGERGSQSGGSEKFKGSWEEEWPEGRRGEASELVSRCGGRGRRC